MSNYLAIATVTKALAMILGKKVFEVVSDATAVTSRPDPASKKACVDLFLYQVTPNAALANSTFPTRNDKGQVISRPTIALDLHYLLSFYGDDAKFEPQRMLGAVLTTFLAKPGLTRADIDAATSENGPGTLGDSNLADAVEQIKFTPQSLSLEELSRIWSIFYQVPYALSVGYIASVVLIESEEPALAAPPVLRRGQNDQGVETQLGPFPQLESWHIGEGDDDDDRLRLPSYPSARLGTILTLRGQNLGGDALVVQFSNPHLENANHILNVPATPVRGRPNQIKLTIPAVNPAAPDSWVAGIYSVSIVVSAGGSTRATNSLPLTFAPQFILSAIGAHEGGDNVLVTATSTPVAKITQPVFLALPDRDVAAKPRTLATAPLEFLLIKPVAGPAIARLRVDGVDSLQFKGQGTPPRPVLDQKILQIPPK